MANVDKSPYDILGVPQNIGHVQLRTVYRTRIHEYLQKKISAESFQRVCRAYETLSDFDKRKRYDEEKQWTYELPIDQYTRQQLAAEPHLINHLKKRLEKADLIEINGQDAITGHTTLYCAARSGNLEAVKFLTDHGAEPDLSQRTKSTALHVASFYGHANVVRSLLESGADYRVLNNHNNTAEIEAFNNDVKKVFTELKQNPYVRVAADELDWFKKNNLIRHQDTEYFAQRQTLLHCASKKGYFDMVRWLVEQCSANIDLFDFNDNSALHLAAYGGHANIVSYLLNRGCDPTHRNRWGTIAEEEGIKHGERITELFKSMRERDMFEMAREGVDWWFYYYFNIKLKDKADSNGVSLLYYACRYGKYSVAKWLLERGANVNIQMTTQSKSTPLHGAKYHGHVSIVELLLKYDADVNIQNAYRVTAFDEEIHQEVDKNVVNKINELLQQHQNNLKGEKLLDIYVYENDGNEEEAVANIQLRINATKKDLLAALPARSIVEYPYFSVARRVLDFEKEDTTIISAVCRARYTTSKFINTTIRLIRHRTLAEACGSQQSTRKESPLQPQRFLSQSKITRFSLKAPLTKKTTINVGQLMFTFSERSINGDMEFKVTTLFSPDLQTFGLPGCICLFKIDFGRNMSTLDEPPDVSFDNEQHVRLYTMAAPTAYWFTSHTRKTRLPTLSGIHAFVRHVVIIPNHLTLPADMFIAGALGKPLTRRNNPVPCDYLLLREQNTHTFPLIAYHGTNINGIQSILLDGLVVPGTVVSSGKRIQPPSNHFAREKTYFNVEDFAAAIFLSPSIYYSSDPLYSATFSVGDQQLMPVLECSVKRNSYDAYSGTVQTYTLRSGDDKRALEWRVKDPANIEINGVLFITKINSIAVSSMNRLDIVNPQRNKCTIL